MRHRDRRANRPRAGPILHGADGGALRAPGEELAPVHEAPRSGELDRIALDPSRARVHLGWEPFTPLSEGIKEVVVSLRR